MDITSDLNWLKTHVILIFIVIALSLGTVYGVETLIAKHDAASADKWQAILTAQTAQTKAFADQLNADEKNWSQQNTQQEAIISQLAVAISQRDKTTAIQIQKDATLSATDAAQRISEQTKAKLGEVTAQGNNIQLDLSVSRTVVAGLDQIPALTADLVDTQKQLVSETTIADNLQSNLTEEKSLIESMKLESQDADKSCKAEISSLKADSRKGKLKWFWIGVVVGFVGARVLGI